MEYDLKSIRHAAYMTLSEGFENCLHSSSEFADDSDVVALLTLSDRSATIYYLEYTQEDKLSYHTDFYEKITGYMNLSLYVSGNVEKGLSEVSAILHRWLIARESVENF